MHEQRVVVDLIRKATEVAAGHHAERLSAVTIRVGALSHVPPASIAGGIRQHARGTPLELARIDVITGPGGAAALADEHATDVILQSVEIEGG
ncbi:MAG TPA: hydrogenase/urease maturation nickel metallochaperone HypA [Acidimicrobiia bacterium]|nr:hydrogenase/urease maturation nickel metallochaperone HypA [Acidimicrobiia bacterium]